ncbi:non-ribosomal peptide synthetase [Xylariales sp. AK1849]|nr:non-ribosomal peptide synthetase [Xylariales sp. AK1849]
MPSLDEELSEESIASAAEAVADALGLSLSELPQHVTFTRAATAEARRTSSIYLPPGDATWTSSVEDSIEKRLSMAVADTLGLDSKGIPRDESFVDLGGDQRTARTLRAKCMHAGLSVKTKDILGCKTIAELETRVTPLSPSPLTGDAFQTPTIVSPLQLSSPISSFNHFTANPAQLRQIPTNSMPAAQAISRTHLKPKASRRYHNHVEQVLSLNEDIGKAAVLKPKAGLFEGQVTAFLTLSSCVIERPNDSDVKLLNAYYTSKLPAIRKLVEAKVPPAAVPSVWVVLEQMPMDDCGRIHRRKLQTWIQNINEELHHQIMSIDSQEFLTAPATDIERRLQKVVAKVLDIEQRNIGMNVSFTKLGGDPTTAMQLVVRCKSQGISLKAEDITQSISLTQLASMATPSEVLAGRTSEDTAEPFDLSPMQWFYLNSEMGHRYTQRADRGGSYRFNQSILFRLRKSIGIEDVRAAVEAIVGHHAMLRARFRCSDGVWSQRTLTEISSSYHFGHHTVGTNAEVEAVVQEAQANIDIENGPVFAAHHFHTNDGYQMLYLVAHHLVVDIQSWRIITDDLEELLIHGNLVSGRALSFQAWSVHQRRRVRSIELVEEVPFDVSNTDYAYWGINSASNKYGNTTASGFTLGPEIISVLEASNRVLRTDSSDIFMAALLLSFSQAFRDRQAPTIWNQEHERAALDAELDISEIVGWHTSLCPLALGISPSDDFFSVLCRVKDARRAVPEHGVPFFAANCQRIASSMCPLEVIFTYAGSMQTLDHQESLLEQLPVPGRSLASKTSDIGPEVSRISVFEVTAAVDHGDAKFKILYHRSSRHQDRIQGWIQDYEALLRESILGLQYRPAELSMSDVPLLDMDYEGLTKLNREVLPSLGVDVECIEAIYPVTANQQNILINEQLIPDSSRSQMIYELHTLGKYVDVGRICGAWQQVVEKHSALKTVFFDSVSKLGLFDQLILRQHSPSMLFIESEHGADAVSALEKLSPANLTKGIPWHRLVVCRAPGETLLKMETSQALCDAASVNILFHELEQAYFQHSAINSMDIDYSEYLQCLKTTPCSVEFWRESLEGVQPCHFPSLVSNSLDMRDFEHSYVDLGMPHGMLEAFAQKYNLDMAAVLRVAWSLVLRAYVGSDSVCFGYRTSGRDIPVKDISDAVGCYSMTLVCRLAMHSSQFLEQLLIDSEEAHQEALHHQHVSVSDIHHAVQMKGDRLFNTCLSFGYENFQDSLPSAKFQHVEGRQNSEYDLLLDIDFRGGNIVVDVGHRILTSDQAANVAHAFGRAIQTIFEIPGGRVRETDLFSEHDHRQILAWNSQPKTTTPKEHIHEMIAKQAIEYPDIQAVCAWDGDLTYAELDRLSMALASHLCDAGVTRQTPVPVIVEKSRWAVVAMLSVLNAGGSIVPVDAALTSTFSWVIKATGAKVILASERVRKHLQGVDSQVIFIDDSMISSLPEPSSVNLPRTQPDDVACVLFNAEAADTHRGITYSHSALATACVGQSGPLRVNPSSRVMHISSYCVDISLSEMFTTLINGACICVARSSSITDLTNAAQRMNVNWTYLTPTLSRRLQPESLPDLAVVCFRTHQLDEDVYRQWAGKARVILAYGSAEACVFGISASEVKDVSHLSCIGTPFSGNFWVVNPEDSNKLMPVGAVGELVISSPTLATGHNLDRKTKRLFSRDLCRNGSGPQGPGRLLKTGHYVRYREHGQVELVSTQSGKIEFDGNLVEASDIERRLRRCLGRNVDVAVETIAFNYTDSDSTPIMAGFVELGGLFHEDEDLTNLSRSTKERLYLAKKIAGKSMRDVPSTFIPVRQMPLTPSLEISHHGLQRMIMGLSKSQLLGLADVPDPHEVSAPGLKPLPLTAVEERLRSIWATVLGIAESSIYANDTFQGLGGDNHLAHDIVIACRRQGIEVSIKGVIRLTLAELCRDIGVSDIPISVEQSRYMQPSPSNAFIDDEIVPQVGFDRDCIEDVAEASATQIMFVESGLSKSKGNINYFLINMTGLLDWAKLENACYLLTAAHPILRTAFASHNRQLFQTVIRSYHPDFQRIQCNSWRLSGLATKLIKRDQAMPVDFRQPITRFLYLDAGKTSTLVLRLARAQYNDLSLPILIKDLGQLYEHGDLFKPRVGFCDVVRKAQHASLNGTVDYWKTLLDGSTVTQVISAYSPALPSPDSETVHQQIPTGSLQNLGVPFETILKGAWSIVLSNLSGRDDVVFGQLVEGKHLYLPDVVGPTGNIIPVRTIIPSTPVSPMEFLRSVQTQHVASIPHENLQFSDIVQKCTSWKSWTRFSTIVQHQNQGERETLSNFTIGSATCKLNCIGETTQDSDIFVRAITGNSNNATISLTFSEKRIQPFFIQEVLSMLCSTISLLTSAFIMEPIALGGLHENHSSPRIPLPSTKPDVQITNPVLSVLPDHASAIHTVISTGWDTVLGAQALKLPEDIRSVPFYDFSCSLVPAAELARYYTESMSKLNLPGLSHTSFTLEDILENPTMMKQYELIISKQQGPQLKHSASFSQRSWSKNVRRLAVTGNPPHIPIHSAKRNGGSTSSMESMTNGSSHSEEEPHDEVPPLTPVTPHRSKTGMKSSDVKKRSPMMFGRIKFGSLGV